MSEREHIAWSLRAQVIQRDKSCVYCGEVPAKIEEWGAYGNDGRSFHFDHKVPLAKGGKTTLENLVLACAKCNLNKGKRRSPFWPPWAHPAQLRLPLEEEKQ